MDLNPRSYFTTEHEIFRKTVRSFVEKELLPHKTKWESERFVPKEIFKRLGEEGFLGINYPTEYGGSGCDLWFKVVLYEELLRCRMNGFVMDVVVQSDISTGIIDAIGTQEQKLQFLKPAIAGLKVGGLGITEPNAGSDVARIATNARRKDDHYLINGSKMFITNGNRADFITLAARTGPALNEQNFSAGHKGISLIIFPTHDDQGKLTPGFSTQPIKNKLGNHSSDTAELYFENSPVPIKNLLGEEHRGFYYIMQNFQGERLHAAVMSVACCQILLEDAIRYGYERQAFGQPIIKFQVWQHRFAELATQIAAARELTYRACDLFNQKIDCVTEISMAKLFSTELVNRVANEALQFHGGSGYLEEYDVARMFRDVRLVNIGGGASEIMREIIAKRIGL